MRCLVAAVRRLDNPFASSKFLLESVPLYTLLPFMVASSLQPLAPLPIDDAEFFPFSRRFGDLEARLMSVIVCCLSFVAGL